MLNIVCGCECGSVCESCMDASVKIFVAQCNEHYNIILLSFDLVFSVWSVCEFVLVCVCVCVSLFCFCDFHVMQLFRMFALEYGYCFLSILCFLRVF